MPQALRTDRSASFGNVARDGSHAAEIGYANQMTTRDTTSPTNQLSPLAAVSTTVPLQLVIPNNAAAVMLCSTTALRINTTGNLAADGYFVLPANTLQTFACAGTNQVMWLESDSAAGNVSFMFYTI